MKPPHRRQVLQAGAALVAAGLLGLPAAARAGQPRLELELDLTELREGQTVAARVRLVDAVLRGRPELPVGDGLQARFTGQSQQHVVVNFQSTRMVDYSYALTAVAPGTWTVGPVQVQVGDRTLRAEAVTVTVAPRSAEERAGNDVTASLSDEQPYLGQVVVYRFRHQHQDRVLELGWTPPTWDGFVPEKTAEAAQREYQVEQDGVAFQVEEVWVPLVAAAEGPRTVPPAVLTVRVPSQDTRRRSPFLGGVETRTLSSRPLSTTIRPLPAEGRPPDFSGLVGTFQLDGVVRREGQADPVPAGQPVEVPLGGSVTLELRLVGDGTLAGVSLPTPPQSEAWRAYDDAPEIVAEVQDGRFRAQATFRRAIVPTREGEVRVDPVRIPVFDPQAGRYVTLETAPVLLRVTPGQAPDGQVRHFGGPDPDATVDARQEVHALGEDILPVPGGASVRDHSLAAALPWALGLPALPGLGLLALGLDGLLRRRAPDPRAALRGRLRALPEDPAARLAALETAFREACGLRLHRPAPGLDRAAVAALGPDAAALDDDLARARYGGFSPGGDLEARVRAFVEAT
ncbi:BatD family protein [Myxococcota bacterium]|nr:BatD family protein [Myxococcota bacterium]